MAGSIKTGITLRKTMIEKYGSEQAWKAHMAELGRKGGKIAPGPFRTDRALAKRAGALGGKISKRRPRI